jgi:hypothetical protein
MTTVESDAGVTNDNEDITNEDIAESTEVATLPTVSSDDPEDFQSVVNYLTIKTFRYNFVIYLM